MTDYLTIKNGEDEIKVDKDKIRAAELKSDGIINLLYEDESASPVSVQVNEENDSDGFAEALNFIENLDGGYSS